MDRLRLKVKMVVVFSILMLVFSCNMMMDKVSNNADLSLLAISCAFR